MDLIFEMGSCCGSNQEEDDIELNTKKPIVIFVIGAPGTGKTVQCKKFEKEYDFKIISITDILSKIVTQDQKGVLISILKDELAKTPKPITLIDGYPRDENDLAEWNRFLASNYNDNYVIYFYCLTEIMKYRLLKEEQEMDDINESIDKYNANAITLMAELEKQKKVIKINSHYEIDRLYWIIKSELEAHSLIINQK